MPDILKVEGTDKQRMPDVYDVVVDGKIVGRSPDPDERRRIQDAHKGGGQPLSTQAPPATFRNPRRTTMPDKELEVEGTGERRVPTENDVVVGGKIIGSDPDARVRAQLERDYHNRNR